jgi:tetratricopeptide (TPR) repeat protein
LEKQAKVAEAEEQYRKAVAITERLVNEFPSVSEYRVSMAGKYCNFGILVRDGGQSRESLKWFDKAIRTLESLDEAVREIEPAKSFLRNSYWGRSRAYDLLQKYQEAVKDWDKVIDLTPQPERRGLRASRASLKHRAGQIAGAVDEVAELTANGPNGSRWSPQQYYDFACTYSVASSRIADKQTEYAARAMELLEEAVKVGWTDAAHMQTDADLDPLRDREDFKKLMSDLKSNSAANLNEKQ